MFVTGMVIGNGTKIDSGIMAKASLKSSVSEGRKPM
jgi:hypothetical protein